MKTATYDDFTLVPEAYIMLPDGTWKEFPRLKNWRKQGYPQKRGTTTANGETKHDARDEAPLWTWFLPNPRPIHHGTR